MQEAEQYMKDFKNTFGNTETLEEKMTHCKQVIDSFQHYLSVISKSIDEGEYNIRMIDDLCEMIEAYYQKTSDENEKDNVTVREMKNKNSDNSSKASSLSVSSKMEKFLEESDTEDSASEKETKKEENTESDSKDKKEKKPSDPYYLPFVNNSVDVNKKIINNVIKKNYDIRTQVNNYIKMHMVY